VHGREGSSTRIAKVSDVVVKVGLLDMLARLEVTLELYCTRASHGAQYAT